MKQLLTAALLFGLCAFAPAQRYGPPACATCITPNNPTPGVPGSATSFTAFNPPPSMGFTAFNPPPSYGVFSASFRSSQSRFGGTQVTIGFGGHHHRYNGGYGYGYGYGYPVYVPAYETQPEPQPDPAAYNAPSGNAMDRELWSRAAEREDKVIDRDDTDQRAAKSADDSRYGEHYLDGRENAGRDAANRGPAASSALEDNSPSLVVVLKDGSRIEMANYAIVGQTIHDLSHRGRKIQLAELDLAATQKANDALGLDFKLPTTR